MQCYSKERKIVHLNNVKVMAQGRVKIFSGRLSSMLLVTVALFLCSLSAYVLWGGSGSLVAMLGDVRVSVEVSDSCRVEPVSYRTKLQNIEGVVSVEYIDSKEAERRFNSAVGVDLNDFMGEDVLPATFLLKIDGANSGAKGVDAICSELKGLSWVGDVYYEKAVPERVEKSILAVKDFAFYVLAVFAIGSLVIMFLGVSMSVGGIVNAHSAAQRRDIVRLVYRWAWIQGVLSSLFAVGLLYVAVEYARLKLPEVGFTLDTLPTFAAVAVAVSTVLSLLFTAISLMTIKKETKK